MSAVSVGLAVGRPQVAMHLNDHPF